MKRPNTLVASMFIIALALGGCASSSPTTPVDFGGPITDTGQQPDFGPPDAMPVKSYRLTIVGWQSLTLQQTQQVVLQVRLTKNEESAANEAVSFAFKGTANDSNLSTLTAITDAQGFAETTLTAGMILGAYQVEANHARAANPVYWNVTVQKKPDTPPPAAKLAGTFTLTNNFNITGKFTGKSGLASLLNLLEDMSDDPNDPGKFIADLIIDEIQSQVENNIFSQISNIFRPLLYQETQKLLAKVPIVSSLTQVAQDLSALARRFTIISQMVSAAPQNGSAPMTVSHTLNRIKWTLDSKTVAYTFSQLGMASPTVASVTLTLSNGQNLAISKHSFDLKFGAFLLVGLNSLIIPKVNGNASSMTDLMKGWVDCTKLGVTMDNATNNLVGAGIWTAGCESGLTMAGSYLEQQVLKLGGDTTTLEIQGQCKLTDATQDGFYDTMAQGVWTGNYILDGNPVVMAGAGNDFTGARTK